MRSSQVCSALQRLRRFGLPPLAALLQPLSRGAARLCGGFAACRMYKLRPEGPKAMQLGLAPKANPSCPQAEAALEGLLPEM
ncbi:hypothetical protein SGRA_1333 [Saprospira grandis str. Lewin]|uniref:Uncharacterized protein n=1 Tax=Saprospira grandis (strain Lewin) TaxID=984262 RepID=H6L6C6_SAPGL|nr:hypothetical protein SGRA_1333 [Saprospira grandis str. Lewin]